MSLVSIACAMACSSSWEDTAPAGTFTFFEAQVSFERITKVDLLLAIDDSPSMADQRVADQVSAMVSRLLSPRCVSRSTVCTTNTDCSGLGANATCEPSRCVLGQSTLGVCPQGLEPEFAPVHDLHVGVVRSSLGCGDAGRLFGGTLAHTKPTNGRGGGFVAWLPRSVPGNANAPAPNVSAYSDGEDAAFIADVRALASEVGTSGCGFESQLESWYRFLIQPDPYASIASGFGAATLEGVDTELLAMRDDFLRSDSLVIVAQITDEDDASVDPLAPSAAYLRGVPLAARSTAACDVDPTSAACSSCALPQNGSDSKCAQQSVYLPNEDGLDVRFGDETKRRYGLDPQWSVKRYVDGLRHMTVSDRDGNEQSNPLFTGSRTPDLVYYALVAGVAPSLLAHPDWERLAGTKRDPRMIESIAPRSPLPLPSSTYTLGSDPDMGREWNTTNAAGVGDLGTGVDFQFACTFDLPAPRDCTIEKSCDCAPGSPGATVPDGPPLCDPNARTMQVRGKAYPGTRLLRVAQGLGSQASIGSICTPWLSVLSNATDRLVPFGDRGCFPEVLAPHADCSVDCQMLIIYPGRTNQSAGCTDAGTSQPDQATLDYFVREHPSDPTPVVCTYRQLGCTDYVGSTCESSPDAGWCYVTNTPNGCRHDIVFSAGGPPAGTNDVLYCVDRR